MIPIVVSLFIVLFVMIFSVVFALFNMNNEKILKGISILGIDISDLTVEEAKTKIKIMQLKKDSKMKTTI